MQATGALGLDEDAAKIMANAFEAAWARLKFSSRHLSAPEICDARIRLARAILERVQAGERDASRLRDLALASVELVQLRGRSSYL
jgi:hypothetical protein